MIEARQLTKWYGPHLALDRVDLDVPKGHIRGFLGPNGAGKSTTLRILTCNIPPTDGSATLNGHDVITQSMAVRRSIGYLPESTPLYPEMRVREQLDWHGTLHTMARKLRRQRIGELTERCGLETIIDRPIGHLSKGNRQRVGIAQALLHDPPVIILDEPTAGLDPTQIREVRKLIRSLREDKTILLSTHILPEAEKTCDSLTIINRGRVVASGTPEELVQQARSGSAIVMEIQAEAEPIRQKLVSLSSVAEVVCEPIESGWTRASVTPADPQADLRQTLAETAAAAGWTVRELRPETGSLETYFIQATDHEQKRTA